MESDRCYTIDFSKSENDKIFAHLRETLIADGYAKVKCDNIPDEDYNKVCLDVIKGVDGIGCPYGKDPQGLVWSVKVLALDSQVESMNLPGTNVDRELHFHTDCSYEHNAPDYIGLFIVQCDRSEHGGKFQLVHTKEIIDQLSPKTKQLLHDETYKIIVRPAYQKEGHDSIWGPIILSDARMRYQPDLVDEDQLLKERLDIRLAIDELNSILFSEDKLNIFRPVLHNHMMILFNNHQFLHGRTKIEDIDRHLLRVRFNLEN
jgi:alpha-ketoglutarate-dependent taurine dioxygenase